MRSLLPIPLDWKHYLPFRPAAPREVRDTWRLADGTPVILRASRTDDGELIQHLIRNLSLRSRYQRFFYPLHELTPDMLTRFIHNAPTEAMTLLAVIQRDGREVAIAMAQYVADSYPERCDFAVVVADAWQGNGLGRKLIESLMCIARAAGVERMQGDILAENEAMRKLMLKMGFRLTQHEDGAYLRKASKRLVAPEWKCTPLTALATRERTASAYA
ncbi:GNAT family N-acetyltransferase [Herbaspirillum sp. HC18]|nr:GNAT family N-acetyltransferase [Herbaspirillum sp. HC18]